MIDVAHRAVDDRGDLALALADAGGNAAHARDTGDALHHEHIARLGEVVRLDIGEPGDLPSLRRLEVEHGERAPDDASGWIRRAQCRSRYRARNAAFIERIGRCAGEIFEGKKSLDDL